MKQSDTSDLIQYGDRPLYGNAAGVAFLQSLKRDPHAKYRCVRDYPWQCPYLKKGGHCPCIRPKASDKKHLATVEYTNYERVKHPTQSNGQMQLFPAWQSTTTGEIVEGAERPYQHADLVCKEFAVATMEWLKRNGWSALKWRVLPFDEDMWWVSQQQVKFSGRYSACVFDVWE